MLSIPVNHYFAPKINKNDLLWYFSCQKIWRTLIVHRTFALANRKMANFRFANVLRFYGDRSEAVRSLSHIVQIENWPLFCLRVQRYDEHLGVSKFFGQKMQSIFILPSPPYKTILFNPIFAHFNPKYYIITLLQKNVR